MGKPLYEKGRLLRTEQSFRKELDTADETLTVALLMNYQMGAMEEDAFKQLMAQQTGQDASVFENMTIEQIGEMMHVELKNFQQEKRMTMETKSKSPVWMSVQSLQR